MSVSYSLIHDNADSIVKQTLAEDDGIQFWINLVLVEDSEDRHGVRRRQCRPESETFQQPNVETLYPQDGIDKHEKSVLQVINYLGTMALRNDSPYTDGRDECAEERKCQYGPGIPEEILLPPRVCLHKQLKEGKRTRLFEFVT